MFESRDELGHAAVHRSTTEYFVGAPLEGVESLLLDGPCVGVTDEVLSVAVDRRADPALLESLHVNVSKGYGVRIIRRVNEGHSRLRYEGEYKVQKSGLGFTILIGGESKGGGDRATPAPPAAEAARPLRSRSSREDEGMASHAEDVRTALELVAETTATVKADIDSSVEVAARNGDYDEARRLIDIAERLSRFAEGIGQTVRNWDDITGLLAGQPAPTKRARSQRSRRATKPGRTKRANYGTIDPGLKTSQREFLLPLLKVLIDAGGQARARDALSELFLRMEPQLKSADLETLKSGSEVRWRSTAKWARQELVNRGLMEPSREQGLWEISDAGREYVAEQDQGV